MSKEAMKQALKALKAAWNDEECSVNTHIAVKGGIIVLEEALAKQEQGEPVADAWMHEDGRMTDAKAKIAANELFKGWRALGFLNTTPQQRKPLTDECCTWKNYDDFNMPDTWEADCGAMWTFTEGGPKDNDMKFCPNCGKPTIEAAHGIKE